ncbi:hypothetical protein MNV_960008 [Candidatus Methanoperedens nitroreducens]|uniref:Uncharacterized protein n=1 Tax=Candidatus Methanoperedens nitratireducens TaxID=1392998 RepID=A0A284VUC6_9EURY|nr:hypothetical protein [Candidatus Methanoperedens nitroreducens]SNQ62895.1 hypothetical protein MNV_960008 [Candidatus Methanoperedens nitroreducens]
MVGHEFAFYVTLKPNMIKDLKIRCDYREEFEFGVIDLGIPMSELKKIVKKR